MSTVVGLRATAIGLAAFPITPHQRTGAHFAELGEARLQFAISVLQFLQGLR